MACLLSLPPSCGPAEEQVLGVGEVVAVVMMRGRRCLPWCCSWAGGLWGEVKGCRRRDRCLRRWWGRFEGSQRWWYLWLWWLWWWVVKMVNTLSEAIFVLLLLLGGVVAGGDTYPLSPPPSVHLSAADLLGWGCCSSSFLDNIWRLPVCGWYVYVCVCVCVSEWKVRVRFCARVGFKRS